MGRDSEAKYVADQLLDFVGGAIIGIVVSEGETEWEEFPGIRVRARDGSEHILWIQQDAEGNGPGWITPEKVKEAPRPRRSRVNGKRNGTAVAAAEAPSAPRDEKQRRCLALLAEEGDRLTPEYVAKNTGLRVSSTKFALGVLTAIGLVSHNAGAYRVTDKGRAALANGVS